MARVEGRSHGDRPSTFVTRGSRARRRPPRRGRARARGTVGPSAGAPASARRGSGRASPRRRQLELDLLGDDREEAAHREAGVVAVDRHPPRQPGRRHADDVDALRALGRVTSRRSGSPRPSSSSTSTASAGTAARARAGPRSSSSSSLSELEQRLDLRELPLHRGVAREVGEREAVGEREREPLVVARRRRAPRPARPRRRPRRASRAGPRPARAPRARRRRRRAAGAARRAAPRPRSRRRARAASTAVKGESGSSPCSELATDVAHLDLGQAGRRLRAAFRVAVGALAPDRRDRLLQLLVGGAAANERAKVVAAEGEETGVEAALGGDAGPGAVAAEGLRDRGDQADLAGAVAVAPALGDLTAVARIDRLERELGGDPLDDLAPPERRRRAASRWSRRRPCTR